jgi:GT2 family glycosyltransferase
MTNVCAVIPIHNGVNRTIRCLRSLMSGTFVPRTVVVDDGSSDGSGDLISSEFPEVTILRGDGNLWWSGAMNLGVDHALAGGADYILSLNNDCVLDLRAVEALVQCAEEENGVIVGSKIRYLDQPEKILCAGGAIRWDGRGPEYLGDSEIDSGQFDRRREVDWVPGMSVLIPAEAFGAAGLYDARRFPMRWGDVDFILRAKSKGWRVVLEPRSLVWNDQEQTEKSPYRVNLVQLFRFLTNSKSHYRLVPALRFFSRHAPAWAMPSLLARLYAPLGRGLRRQYLYPVKVWVQSRGRSAT